MKVYVNGKEVEADRVDFVDEDYPDEGIDTHFKLTHEGMIVDIVERETDTVLKTGYQFWDDLQEIAH